MVLWPDKPRRYAPEAFARGAPTTLGEQISAEWESNNYNFSSISRWRSIEKAYDDRIDAVFQATGVRLEHPLRQVPNEDDYREVSRRLKTSERGMIFMPDVYAQQFEDRLRRVAESHPDKLGVIRPHVSPVQDAIEHVVSLQRKVADLDSRAGWGTRNLGALLGGLGSAAQDPLNWTMAPVGLAGSASRSLLWNAFRAGVSNATAEVAAQPFIAAWQREAGLDYGLPEAGTAVAAAFLFGGLLDAGVRAPVRYGDQIFRGGKGRAAAMSREARGAALQAAAKRLSEDNPVRRAYEGDPRAFVEIVAGQRDKLTASERGALDAIESEVAIRDLKPEGMDDGEHLRRTAHALRAAERGEALFAIAGTRARTADHEALRKAEAMEIAGRAREDIWRETGWWRGADSKWRFEIDDSGARFRSLSVGDMVPVDQALEHSRLYNAYPALRNITFERGDFWGGWFDDERNRMSAGGVDSSALETVLHEMQHAVQKMENFAQGGNRSTIFESEEFFAGNKRIKEIKNEIGQLDVKLIEAAGRAEVARWSAAERKPRWPWSRSSSSRKTAAEQYEQLRARRQSLQDEIRHLLTEKIGAVEGLQEGAATSHYMRLAGEVEARAVQARQHLPAAERRARPPWLDYDVPEDKQIVKLAVRSLDDPAGPEAVRQVETLEAARKEREEAGGLAAVAPRGPKLSRERLDAIWADVEKVIDRLPKGTRVRLKQVLTARDLAPGAKVNADLFGALDPRQRIIWASLADGETGMALRHEEIHLLREMGLFRPDEWAALKAHVEKEGLTKRAGPDGRPIEETYRRFYGGSEGMTEERLADLMIEEAVAHLWANHRKGATASPLIDGIIATAQRILRQIREALGRKGVRSIDDVFDRIETGEVGRRSVEARPGGEGFLTAIRAYHGSPYNFDAFDIDRIGTGEGAYLPEIIGEGGRGLYFTGSRDLAVRYRDNTSAVHGSKGKLYIVEIDAERAEMLDLDVDLVDQPPAMREKLIASGVTTDAQMLALPRHREGIEAMRAAGIKGTMFTEVDGRMRGHQNYVVYDDRLVSIVGKEGTVGRRGRAGKAADATLFAVRDWLPFARRDTMSGGRGGSDGGPGTGREALRGDGEAQPDLVRDARGAGAPGSRSAGAQRAGSISGTEGAGAAGALAGDESERRVAAAFGFRIEQTLFHGTRNAPVVREHHFSPLHADPNALYGPAAAYLTDDQHIAGGKRGDDRYDLHGYAGDPAVFPNRGVLQVWHSASKLFDADKDVIKRDWLPDELRGYVNDEMTYDEVGKVLRAYVPERADGSHPLRILNRSLRQAGFDGIAHEGGGRYRGVGSARHRVTIVFDPKKLWVVGGKNPFARPSGATERLMTGSGGHGPVDDAAEEIADVNGSLAVAGALRGKAGDQGSGLLAAVKGEDSRRSGVIFRTAKGSTYYVHDDGTTVRDKAERADPGHEGDKGIKEKSARTVYVRAEDAQRLAPPSGRWRIIEHPRGRLSLLTWNAKENRWGLNPSSVAVAVADEPTAGLMPLELWGPETADDGRVTYGKMHLGNEITEVSEPKTTPQAEVKAEAARAPVDQDLARQAAREVLARRHGEELHDYIMRRMEEGIKASDISPEEAAQIRARYTELLADRLRAEKVRGALDPLAEALRKMEAAQTTLEPLSEALKKLRDRGMLTEADVAAADTAARTILADELEAEAIQRKRVALLTEALAAKHGEAILTHRNARGELDPAEYLTGVLEHFGLVHGGVESSVEGRRKAILGRAHGRLEELLNEFRRTAFTGRRMQRARLENVVRAAFGENTDDAVANALARAWGDVAEELRQRFNAAGGSIGRREDWGLPQWHDARALRARGLRAWKRDITPLLDSARMVNPLTGMAMTGADLDRALDHVFESITSDGWNTRVPMTQLRGRGALYRQRAEHRFLVFRDADAWMAYNREYGHGGSDGIFAAMMGHLNTMSRDIAAMEVLGPSPTAMLTFLQQVVEQQAAFRLAGRPAAIPLRSPATGLEVDPSDYAAGAVKRSREMWAHMRGNASTPLGSLGASTFAVLRNLITASTLGGAAISSISDLGYSAMARRFAGLTRGRNPHVAAMLGGIGQMRHLSRREAVRAGLIMESAVNVMHAQARYVGSMNGPLWSQYLSDRILTLSGLTPWTNAGRHAFGLEFMGAVADEIGREWGAMTPPLRATFERYGLGEAEWELIRTAAPQDGMLRPDGIDSIDRTIADRYLEMILQETEYAVPSGTVAGRSLILGENRPGTLIGEMLRTGAQFKNFGVTVTLLQGGRLAQMIGAGQRRSAARYAASLLITSALYGAFIIQAKELSRGKDPRDMADEKFWGAAALQAGGLGIYGDFLFGDLNRFGGGAATTLSGPLAGRVQNLWNLTGGNIVQLAQGEETSFGREANTFLRQNVPGSSIWYLRLAYERILMDELQKLIDPKAREAFRRKIQFQRKQFGNEFWWAPGTRAPQRPPVLP